MVGVASSSSSVELPPPQHQVFLNFRGKELRYNFVSHLEKALRIDGVNVFIDRNETKGKDLSIFFTRIEKSRIALAIFSSQYADSSWCLDELVKIKECVDLGKLVVIPIFYKVETDDVQEPKGIFGDKFRELAKTCNGEKREKWKQALNEVPKKLGFTLTEMSDEGEFIDKIVGEVKKVLSEISTDLEREIPIDAGEGETPGAASDSDPHLFGIETRLMQLEEKLDIEFKSTLTIGVVGMPGIGKTTLTETLYKKWQGKFLRYAFLRDVRKMLEDDIMVRNILMKKLLRDDDLEQEVALLPPDRLESDFLKARLIETKSLVVLDNVSHKKQIEDLLGQYEWIKNGSLIIITTSDRSAIEGMVDDTYEVQRLTGRDSFQYFNHFAFSGNLRQTPEGNFMNLSRLFADYAKGNPLALKILGIELKEKDETHWKEKLRELEQSPNKKIQDVFRISYDGLGQLQKDVFLDVACFFRSGDEYYMRCLVESCDPEPIDGASEIRDLACKFLINISVGRVEMHDLLYTFGKEVGSQGLCRLWNHKGVVVALKKRAGADSVRGIFLDMSKLKKILSLDKTTFSKMRNLRYLKFYSCCHREYEADCKLNFPEGLEFPLDEIRYLYWLKFPLKRLPIDFNPKNLTDLSLPYSGIEEVWEGLKDTPKLKWVDLSHSNKLRSLSGLLNAASLQRLNLEGCTSLEELPHEVMKSLVFLNMRGCTSLRVLPHLTLISMKTLILTNCSNLEKFCVISENLETLHLDGTAIGQLPKEMVKLQSLIVLNLKDCKMLRVVPECLGKLKALEELVLSGCSKLKTFPFSIENMKSLQILLLDGTAIKEMPKILQLNSSNLRELRCGMNGLSSLRRLCLSGNDMISNLQINTNQLYHLKWLDLTYCKNLTSISLLPPNLEIVDAHGCEKLKTVVLHMALLKLMEQVQSKFIFTNCHSLEQVAKNSITNSITTYAQRKLQLDALRCYKEGSTFSEALVITSFPGSEVPSWFNHQTFGSELKLKFPPHWCDNSLSTLVLCAVVKFPQDKINRFSIDCTCEFKSELGTCIRFSCTLGGGWITPRKIDSDHVFIGYTSSSHITKHLEGSLKSPEHHKCVPTEASIEFEVRDGAGEIVNCGLSLVYEEPHHVVVEGNCNGTSSRKDVSVEESRLSFAAGYLSHLLRFMWVGVVFFMLYGFARFFFR